MPGSAREASLGGRGLWFVFTACAVQALVFQHQALNRTPADNVGVHDFIHIRQRDSAIPDGLGINHEIRPVFALVQASRLVGADSAFQTALSQLQLEYLLQLCPGGGIATSARVSGRPLVPADKNMALEFRHPTIVQDWRRSAGGDILISIRETTAMSPQEMRTLFDYNAWANLRSLEAATSLSNGQFIKPLGSSFPSVRDTLAHICGAEWIWHERFQGNSPSSLPDLSSLNTVQALQVHWSDQEAKLLTFVSGLTQADLDRVMEYKTLKFGVYSNPLWQSMQHLVNHGTYHRGQITTLLRQLGAKPILTDLMHFYRERATGGNG